MSDFICITNRKLCREPFLERVKSVAELKPKAIVLREKDLDENEYILLAADVIEIGEKYGTNSTGMAIAWILRHPAKMQPIIGTVNPERIKTIANAADITITHDEWYELYRASGKTLP